MNEQLKKRVRKLIRDHFQNKSPMTYEQKKDLYRIFGIMDEVLSQLDVIDLVSQVDVEKVRIAEAFTDIFKGIDLKVGITDVIHVKYKSKNYSINIEYKQQ